MSARSSVSSGNQPKALPTLNFSPSSSGGQTSLRAARSVLADGLHRLANTPKLTGLAPVRLARIKALLELSRRLCAIQVEPFDEPVSVEALGRRLVAKYRDHLQEHFGAVFMDSRNRFISEREIFVGTLHTAFASPREVLRHGLLENAAAFIVFHNHPSGDPNPSKPDVDFTAQLKRAATDIGFELHDHLVLGRSRYVSMTQLGMI
jgi:DNA repair protein RadC